LGPQFGYFVNAAKTWLVTKLQEAVAGFSGSGIRITSEGRPYLGAAIGSDGYVSRFVTDKVKGWADEITASFLNLRRASHMQRIVLLHMVCLVAGCLFTVQFLLMVLFFNLLKM